MSRIGRLPIDIPAGVEVKIEEGNKVTVKGPKGTLEKCLPVEMTIKQEDNQVVVTRPNDLKKMKSLHGLTRTLINNMVVGVTEGYQKVLEVNGVGYRAAKSGKTLTLNLGYSHPVEMEDPEGVESTVEGQNKIIVKGIDKEKVGNAQWQVYRTSDKEGENLLPVEKVKSGKTVQIPARSIITLQSY